RRLRAALGRRPLHTHPSLVVAPPGAVTTTDGKPFGVFTPYHRRWLATRLRDAAATPQRLTLPGDVDTGTVPTQDDICKGATSPDLVKGGETEARSRANRWYADGLPHYDDDHDALGNDNTSRLSAYLHFGCISPLELVTKADRRKRGVDGFV